jgi:hypothetical protein
MGWSSSLAKTLNSIGWNACALALQVAVYRPRISFGKTKGIRLAIGNCGPKFEIGQGFEHVAILLTHSCRLIVPVNPHFVVEQSNGDKAKFCFAFLCQKTSANSMHSPAWGSLVAVFLANECGPIKYLAGATGVTLSISLLCCADRKIFTRRHRTKVRRRLHQRQAGPPPCSAESHRLLHHSHRPRGLTASLAA